MIPAVPARFHDTLRVERSPTVEAKGVYCDTRNTPV
jgi:hypothetical protein